MTDYRSSINKRGKQTGGAWLGGPNFNADVVNVDRRIGPQDTLTIRLGLSHDAEYIGNGDENYRSPQRTSSINWKAAGVGGIAGGAAVGSWLGPGAAVTAAAGGIAAITAEAGSDFVENATGAIGFEVTYKYRKKGESAWTEMMESTHSVPASGAFSRARKEVTAEAVNTPFNGGDYELLIDVDTVGGEDVAEFTREFHVDKRAANEDGGGNNGGKNNTLEWAKNNPLKAGIGTLGSLVVTRAVVDNTIGGE